MSKLSKESVNKLRAWIDDINKKTGKIKDYSSELAFAKGYIKNAYNFVVSNFNYDVGIKEYLSRFSGKVYEDKFAERANLERFIQQKVGVCKQFATILYAMTASDDSSLKSLKDLVKPKLVLHCIVKAKDGSDSHSCNLFNIYDDSYFCDPTMQKSFKRRNFFLRREAELQKEYREAEGSCLAGQADICEIKSSSLEDICTLINSGRFYRNKETDTYITSLYNFAPTNHR